jgi:hypothetical protein
MTPSAAVDPPPVSPYVAADAPSQAEQASGSWESGSNGQAAAPPWELDADDSVWPRSSEQPAAEAVWQSPAAQTEWDQADPSADTGQFSWRASEQTETFPVIGDDS